MTNLPNFLLNGDGLKSPWKDFLPAVIISIREEQRQSQALNSKEIRQRCVVNFSQNVLNCAFIEMDKKSHWKDFLPVVIISVKEENRVKLGLVKRSGKGVLPKFAWS